MKLSIDNAWTYWYWYEFEEDMIFPGYSGVHECSHVVEVYQTTGWAESLIHVLRLVAARKDR